MNVFVFPGIANRALKPTLGMVDPLHTLHMPSRVAANSGFDVLWYMYTLIINHVLTKAIIKQGNSIISEKI